MELLTRLEDLQTQLDESWPKTLEKTLNEFPHGDEDFYIFTFTKWQYHTYDLMTGEKIALVPPRFDINHCPIKWYPTTWALPGTTLRKISPRGGWVKIMWTLPEEHAFDLFESGKIFADPIVCESIRKFRNGELARDPDETFEKI